MQPPKFFRHTLTEEIGKAARFIKTNQFLSGFPEIFAPERGGEIEVAIVRKFDAQRSNMYEVTLRYRATPGNQTIFQQSKLMSASELTRLAKLYDKDQNRVEQELKAREKMQKLIHK